jgi:hypothetical protein
MNTSDFVKSKALEKLKEINGSKDNSVKAQQWLDGLLKIPFGVYKEEKILKYLANSKVRFKIISILPHLNFSPLMSRS